MTTIATTNPFTEDYFLRGKESGLSNFEDYRWLPDSTISWATHFKRFMGLRDGERVLDVGAARGYYVKALRMIGVAAFGYDVSEWAVANCHPDVAAYMSNHLNGAEHDVVFAKDCFEHIELVQLIELVENLLTRTRRKMFVIVPLSHQTHGPYVHQKEENDKTHVNHWTLQDWILFMQDRSPSFVVNGSFRYPGLKPGAYEVECGYGFIMLDRI